MSGPMHGVMRPSVYRVRLGTFEITNLLDGTVQREGLHATFGGGATPDSTRALAEANNIDANRYEHTFVPTLVNTGKELILFDTGNGVLARDNPVLRGRLPDGNLRAVLPVAGYRPDDIDVVVLTHGHPDHIGGLLDGGQPVFPNARYVIGAAEFDFWKRGENLSDFRKPHSELFVKTMMPLADRTSFIKPGDDIVAGVRAVDAAGHSPGLLAFHIESDGKRVLIWSDTLIHYVMSVQRPECTIDVDDIKDKAVASRKRILDMVATDNIWAIGHHAPFPSIGYVERASGSYRWVAAGYQLYL